MDRRQRNGTEENRAHQCAGPEVQKPGGADGGGESGAGTSAPGVYRRGEGQSDRPAG